MSEPKKLKIELQKSREKYKHLFENIKVGIVVHDRSGRIIEANPEAEKTLGLSQQELKEKPVDYWEGKTYNENSELMKTSEFPIFRVFNSGKPDEGTIIGISSPKHKEIKWYIHNAVPLFDKKGNIDRIMTSFIEITKQIETENELKRSEQKYRSFFQTSRDAVFITSKDGRWIDMNDAAVKLFGYKNKQELKKIRIPDLYENLEDRKRHLAVIEKQGFTKDFAVNLKRKDGRIINTLITSVVVKKKKGEATVYQGIIKDITERKKTEEKMEKSLKEKEVLLREIHHRVKNNLQIVTSLLRLQSQFIRDKEAKQAFRESQNRIYSMALIHEKLYKSQDLARINLGHYIQNFVTHLFHTYEVDTSRIKMSMDTENVQVDINTAIPCGLILNEMVSNAIKHAFPSGQKGEVSIRLGKNEEGKINLSVKDNGRGLPREVNLNNPKSLGLQLIKDLTKQLN
ncbi:MAG TPA: PAS domain S-box protein, partial [Acidobacteriota bacterium]|nr:PAS domain S-box protein [Acidobacteriota bacterium]